MTALNMIFEKSIPLAEAMANRAAVSLLPEQALDLQPDEMRTGFEIDPASPSTGYVALSMSDRSMELVPRVDISPVEEDQESEYPVEFWAELDSGSAVLISANQWAYPFSQKLRLGQGWTAPTANVRASNVDNQLTWALNSGEANNTGEGVEFPGYDVDDLPGTFEYQKLLGNPIVRIRQEFDANNVLVATFWPLGNAIDGDC